MGEQPEPSVPYRKYYDAEKARGYERSKEGRAASHRAECRLVERALAGIPRDETIVDVPCGAGRMTVFLHGLGFHPAAADVSPAMVELARQRMAREGIDAAVEERDLEGTGWPGRAFDNVFCFRFFHHLPTDGHRRRVARELCRVAGKRVVVSYLDEGSWTWRRRALETRFLGKTFRKYPITPRAMARLFEEEGFAVVADHARLPFLHSLRVLVAERASSSRSSRSATSPAS